ncbi:MAG: hypothetical protein JRH01_05845 [Deltaproteobacteria bacterium]|nr:hypothetical protein [Deltaproteobacteria bacterium]MBW2394705.1 hypothetical protein [Deltaproteobacteria bacterium]
MLERIPENLLDRVVTGTNLVPGSLRDQLVGRTLLVFLRHFGCVFCRETLGDLREASEADESFPDVIFFSQASPMESRVFLRRYWPGARAVSDPDEFFYDGFGIERASKLTIFSPQVFAAKRRAAAKGHQGGERSGDIWRMPAAFVVEGDQILWAYEPKHPGDHPDFQAIPALMLAASS